ncbi:MAG TPA: LysM peptidoglycan-binding domain-containing protein, partial [Sphingobacteriaceae bacterium]
MGKKLLFSVFLTFFTISTFAASASRDSIGVENSGGKKVILHKVDRKDSYYAIGRQYKVNPKTIMNFNDSKSLKPGDIVKVPTDAVYEDKKAARKNEKEKEEKEKESKKDKDQDEPGVLQYKVGLKETLYSISKQFNVSIEEIKTLNNLKANSLAVGQVLKIRVAKPSKNVPPSPTPAKAPAIAQRTDSIEIDTIVDASGRLKLPPQRYGLREVTERGVAAYMIDESIDDNKMLALHRTAPIGTIIKITNPMSNKTTFAKVVGKYIDNEAT